MPALVRGSFLSCSQQLAPTSPPAASPTIAAARAQSPGPEQIRPPPSVPQLGKRELLSLGDNGLGTRHRQASHREEELRNRETMPIIKVTAPCFLIHCFAQSVEWAWELGNEAHSTDGTTAVCY